MRAANIIGVNFELWLRIDGGVITHPQILVRQLGVGARGTFVDMNASVECALTTVCHDVVNGLLTAAARLAMFNGYLLIKAVFAAHSASRH